MKSRSGVLLSAVAAPIVTALIVGGVAWAAIPDGDDHEFHACYDNQSGSLRIYDPSGGPIKACGKNETAVTWNQAGQPGPPGQQGPSGLSHAYSAASSGVTQLGPDAVTVLSLDLPAGSYAVFFKTNAATQGTVSCALESDTGPSDFSAVTGDVSSVLVLESTVHLTSAGSVEINCSSTTVPALVAISRLVAIAVDAVN
jgi:hypothetical protein